MGGKNAFSSLLCVLLFTPALLAQSTTSPSDEPGPSANRLSRTPNDVHRLLLDEADQLATGRLEQPSPGLATHTSRVISTEFPFNDLVASWNVDVPQDAGFIVEIRLGRRSGDFWTPFYYLGRFGAAPDPAQKTLRDDNAWVNLDYIQSRNKFDRLQYRFQLFGSSTPVIRRVTLAYSNTLNDAELARRYREPVDPGPIETWARRLPVPFRSQNWQDSPLRGEICSPTSVSMVLEYYGVKLPTVAVCRAIYDADHRMYGNWWRAVQGAYTLGVRGYLERFGDYEGVKRHIARGEPVIASVRIGRGDLRNYPQRFGGGHLVVIAGFDRDGNILLNDPAGRSPERGQIPVHPDDMAKIWLARGGVGYVLEGKAK